MDWYRRALDTDPYLRSAYYALAQLYRQQGKTDAAGRQLDLYTQLADNPRAQLVEFKYTRMGPKCEAAAPGTTAAAPVQRPVPGALFADPATALPLAAAGATPNLTVADIDADSQPSLLLPVAPHAPVRTTRC